jgi:hypothetical protein
MILWEIRVVKHTKEIPFVIVKNLEELKKVIKMPKTEKINKVKWEEEFNMKFVDCKDSWGVNVVGYGITKKTIKNFISQVRQQALEEGKKMRGKEIKEFISILENSILLNKGNLPFVIFGNEEEKSVGIYRQALKDLLTHLNKDE